MKPLLKYPVTLFVLLLIGYGQLFAPLCKANTVYSSAAYSKEPTHYQADTPTIADKEVIYIAEEEEEDDDWVSFKKNSEKHASTLSYLPAHFSRLTASHSSRYPSFLHAALSKSLYLVCCVFRL